MRKRWVCLLFFFLAVVVFGEGDELLLVVESSLGHCEGSRTGFGCELVSVGVATVFGRGYKATRGEEKEREKREKGRSSWEVRGEGR